MPSSFASKRSSEVVSMSKQKEVLFREFGEELLLEFRGVGEMIGVFDVADGLGRFRRGWGCRGRRLWARRPRSLSRRRGAW